MKLMNKNENFTCWECAKCNHYYKQLINVVSAETFRHERHRENRSPQIKGLGKVKERHITGLVKNRKIN